MKLLVGLGNPGQKYQNNRHNVGYMVVDKLKEDYGLRTTDYSTEWEKQGGLKAVVCRLKAVGVVLTKPQTFMNASGSAVKKLVDWFKVSPDNLYVVHDDLDIPLGQYKIQKGKGPKLHYGVQSIDEALGLPAQAGTNYWRVRVGIENRKVSPFDYAQGKRVPRVPRGEQYVLQDFTKEEKNILESVIKRILGEMLKLI